MGLIKALTNSVSTAVGDQFKEFVTCPTVDTTNILIVRGNVQHGQGNTNPSEGVISNGSKIVIPQGWAMMLVDNGKVEFSSEPGEYIYDSGSEPSIFYGGLGKGILNTFKTIGSRFTFGGQTARDQRVYYINLLNVTGNKFGSSSPKDVYDYTYQMSIKMNFYGQFTYRIDDPIMLVSTVLGANVKDSYTFKEVFGDQFRSDVNEQMHKALTQVMEEKKIRFSSIGAYGDDISSALNSVLNAKWNEYGVVITAVSMENIGTTDEYTKIIRDIESKSVETRMVGQAKADEARMMGQAYSDNMAGTMAAATAEAMKNAASNDNGAMMGFAGLNFAQNAGMNIMGTVAGMGNTAPQQTAPEVAPVADANVAPETEASAPVQEQPVQGGALNFCPNCGSPTNGANFCSNCGTKLN